MSFDAQHALNQYSLPPQARRLLAKLGDCETTVQEQIDNVITSTVQEFTDDGTITISSNFTQVLLNGSSAITVTVPAASTDYYGYFIYFYNTSDLANVVSMTDSEGLYIGLGTTTNAAEITFDTDYGDMMSIVCDGTRWIKHAASGTTYTSV